MLSRVARWQPVLGGLAVCGVVAALYMAFVYAPEERTLGVVQRIFYFHVGAAVNAFLAFFVVAACSGLYLITRQLAWDRLAVASAEVGVLFTTITLLTGSIWARPVWNTWWTWEPKLTTTLILWFLYAAYLLIRWTAEGNERQARFAAVFGVLGFVDVPVVHVSSKLWRGLHPVIVSAEGGPAMAPQMLHALAVAIVAYFLLYAFLVSWHVRLSWAEQRLNELKERAREQDERTRVSGTSAGIGWRWTE